MLKALDNSCRQIRDVKLYLQERDGEENGAFDSNFNEASVYNTCFPYNSYFLLYLLFFTFNI